MATGYQQTWADRPTGMRDVFPQFARFRRQVESRLLHFFEQEGYELVSSGAFEYVDTLLRGREREESDNWVQLFDLTGRAIALRPDMTPSIARMAAPMVAAGRSDIRWCYAEKVYSRTNDPASLSWASGRAAESTQVGVEWIGKTGASADENLLELVRLALQTLELSDWQTVIGHAKFVPAFLESVGVPGTSVGSLVKALIQGDYVSFRGQADVAGIPWDVLSVMTALNPFDTSSVPDRVRSLWQESKAGHLAAAAWDEVTELARELTQRGFHDGVSFDLTLCREVPYYTGIVFEVFAAGAGAPVAFGGRYDDLIRQYGATAPAIGFTFELERLLTVITQGGWLHGAGSEEDW